MANPTTAPPANPEWDSTANPNLRMLVPLLRTVGSPPDCVGNVCSRPYVGYNTNNTGTAVTPVTNGFSVSGIQAASYPFRQSTEGLYFVGRGWASGTSVATPRTFAVLISHNYITGTNAYMGTQIIPLIANASDSGAPGLAIQVSTSGVVTLGFYRAFAFNSSGIILSANNWYAVALTSTAASGAGSRIYNCYDYGAQSLISQATVTDATAWSINSTNNNAVIMADSGGAVQLAGCAILAAETWDSGTNTRFADYFADPWLWARGTYAPSVSALVTGAGNITKRTTTTVTVTCARPTGGNSSGAYTYQWYYSDTDPTFVPPGAGTLLTGQTSLVCADTTVSGATTRFYKMLASDSSASVYPEVIAGGYVRGNVSMGFIGDSITANVGTYKYVAYAANQFEWRMNAVGRALGGSFVSRPLASTSASIDAAHSWAPGSFFTAYSGTVSSGTFTLTWLGQTTAPIAFNATPAVIRAALELLSTVGSGNVAVSTYTANFGSASPASITFTGAALPSPVGASLLTTDSTLIVGGGSITAYSLYGTAIANWLAESVTDLSIMIGTNDAGVIGASSANFQTALQNFITDVLASGITRVIIHQIPYRLAPNGSSTVVGLVVQYNNVAASLVNGTTIVLGDQTAFPYFARDNALVDGLHPTVGGYIVLGFAWWIAIRPILDPASITATYSRCRVVGGGQ